MKHGFIDVNFTNWRELFFSPERGLQVASMSVNQWRGKIGRRGGLDGEAA